MGVVYLAAIAGPGGFNKLLALKELKQEFAQDPTFVTMFLDEARLSARLSHPNVVQINEVMNEGGRCFFVMEYLDGRTLSRVANFFHKQGGIPRTLYLRVLCDMLEGLHYAHELTDLGGVPLNIVHRDVSPHNVFVLFGGQIKVVDFGIAKASDSSQETSAGVLKGKVAYMAPEQAQGLRVTRQADIYSAGVMLWEALTGRRLWAGKSDMEIISKVMARDVPSPTTVRPDVPEELVKIWQRATAFNAQDRYATAAEMREDIETYLKATGDMTTREVCAVVSEVFAEERKQINKAIEQHLRALKEGDTKAALPRIRMPGGSHMETASPLSPISRPPGLMGTQTASDAVAAEKGSLVISRRGVTLGGAALVAVVAASVGIAVWKKPPPAPVPAPVVAATVAPAPKPEAPAPSAPDTVSVSVRAVPDNARVMIDGVMMQGNPVQMRYVKSSESHIIRAVAPGFVAKERTLVFDNNVVIELSLDHPPAAAPVVRRPLAKPAPKAAAPAKPAPVVAAPAPVAAPKPEPAAPKSGPRRRIDPSNPYGAE